MGLSTTTATTGSTKIRTFSITSAETRSDTLAPNELPITAMTTVGKAMRQFTSPSRINRTVASAVPQVDESLLVAMARWTGTPASM